MEKQSEASQILVVGGSTQEDSGKKKKKNRDFPGGPWLRLHASTVEGTGSIPGQGTKAPHFTWPKKKNPGLGRHLEPSWGEKNQIHTTASHGAAPPSKEIHSRVLPVSSRYAMPGNLAITSRIIFGKGMV